MKKKLLVLMILLLCVTGCTKQLKDADNKLVKNEETGQTLTKNILCQPEEEETIKKYNETLENARKTYQEQLEKKEITQKQYDKKMASLVDISTLPKCGEFSVTDSGYEGIWTTIFVKPLAWLILKIGGLVKNYGVSVVIITILIRLCMYPITKKTALQSERMNEVKPELERLEKKYKNKTDQQSMVMKSQETMLLYKKYGINPISGCVFAFIQIPLFFAFYEALNRLPAIFEGKFLGLELGTTAGTAILNGKVYYLLVVVLVVLVTYFSMKLNKTASMDASQESTMKMMTNMMIVMISIASFTISTSITLYWITNSTFTIVQNLLVKRRKADVKVI